MIRILQPYFLLLLVLIPAMWYTARRVRVLGKGRKTLTLFLRTLVLLLFILALSEVELVERGETLTVFFVIDRSTSVPSDQQMFSLNYVEERLVEIPEGDEAGIIFLGKDSAIQENPHENVTLREYQAILNTDGTDIESGINLAMAAFPEGVQKRIVLLTDGNQTQGDAERAAQRAKAHGIDLRLMPLEYSNSQEVLVEDVIIPSHIREKEPFTIKTLISAQEEGPGVLRLTENGTVIAEQEVELKPGKNAFMISRSIEESGVYNYEASVEAENDRRPSNNRAQNFAIVKGTPRVLLLESETNEGRYLAASLISEGIDVDMRLPEALPSSLRELQMFDSVLVSNVPASDLTRPQQKMLQTAVSDLGIGLIMIGGPESFGAGGYLDSPLAKALPVEMDIKQRKVIPSGALALITHSCEIPQGNTWTQKISLAAIDVLSRNDYVGFLRYSYQQGGPNWLFPMARLGDKRLQRQAIINLPFSGIGDMPSFDNTLQMAYDGLKDLPANLKHIVLLSDGDPARPNRPLLDKIKEAKITITTVCINPHSQRDVQMMEELAQYGGGNFYDVKNNNNLPKIFIKEATIVRRNLILEDPFTPVIRQISEIIQGFESGFPQLDGYVVTGPKTGAETVLITHKKDPLLAHWRFGLGKAVAFTSDAKPRWAKSWIGNEQYNQFWGQLVRWSLRSGQQNSFQVQTALEGDRVKVVVDALTDEGEFVNNLAFAASAIDPGHEARPFEIRQIEPGRYEGSFPADQKGSHLVNMTFKGKDSEDGYLTSGISIPYSPEHNTTRQNDLVLKRLSEISGKPALETEESVFEHDLQSTGDMLALWPILLGLAIALFFCDVAVRRVFFDVPQLQRFFAKAWNWLIYPFVRRTAPVGPATEQLGQLMQAKTRASVDAPMPSEEKEEFLKRLETVKEGDLAELDTLPAEGSKPWQEANVRDEPEKFAETEEEKDAYTSALFRAKLRAKDSIDKR